MNNSVQETAMAATILLRTRCALPAEWISNQVPSGRAMTAGDALRGSDTIAGDCPGAETPASPAEAGLSDGRSAGGEQLGACRGRGVPALVAVGGRGGGIGRRTRAAPPRDRAVATGLG